MLAYFAGIATAIIAYAVINGVMQYRKQRSYTRLLMGLRKIIGEKGYDDSFHSER